MYNNDHEQEMFELQDYDYYVMGELWEMETKLQEPQND